MRNKSTTSPSPKTGRSSSPSFDGWNGRVAHPNSPNGGGGPGGFTQPKPLGVNFTASTRSPHPLAPANRNRVPSEKPVAGPPLEWFSSGVAGYSKEEMNDALLLLFGEVSTIMSTLDEEIKAAASTLFNRATLIDKTRRELMRVYREKKKIEKTVIKFKTEYSNLLKQSKNQNQTEEIKAELNKQKVFLNEVERLQNSIVESLKEANDNRLSAESYIKRDRVGSSSKWAKQYETGIPRVTLTEVINGPKQYEAQFSGSAQKRFDRYSRLDPKSKQIDFQRWERIKQILTQLAQTPSSRTRYISFLAHQNGFSATKTKADLINGKQIGGNDFWELSWGNMYLP
ncbi:MAG: hypothetical protein HY774_15495 [Acidobacteria bacterium]|nr:hypothetical protein [Acidobacteriota bacterium]